MNIQTSANNLLAKEKLGINSSVNIKYISIVILEQELNDKRLLCKIV